MVPDRLKVKSTFLKVTDVSYDHALRLRQGTDDMVTVRYAYDVVWLSSSTRPTPVGASS